LIAKKGKDYLKAKGVQKVETLLKKIKIEIS